MCACEITDVGDFNTEENIVNCDWQSFVCCVVILKCVSINENREISKIKLKITIPFFIF